LNTGKHVPDKQATGMILRQFSFLGTAKPQSVGPHGYGDAASLMAPLC